MLKINPMAIADKLISVEQADDKWELRLHGRKECLGVVSDVYVVAHRASQNTCEEFATHVKNMVAERIAWEIRQQEAKAA